VGYGIVAVVIGYFFSKKFLFKKKVLQKRLDAFLNHPFFSLVEDLNPIFPRDEFISWFNNTVRTCNSLMDDVIVIQGRELNGKTCSIKMAIKDLPNVVYISCADLIKDGNVNNNLARILGLSDVNHSYSVWSLNRKNYENEITMNEICSTIKDVIPNRTGLTVFIIDDFNIAVDENNYCSINGFDEFIRTILDLHKMKKANLLVVTNQRANLSVFIQEPHLKDRLSLSNYILKKDAIKKELEKTIPEETVKFILLCCEMKLNLINEAAKLYFNKNYDELEHVLINWRKEDLEKKFTQFYEVNYNFSQTLFVVVLCVYELCNSLITQKELNVDKFCKDKEIPKSVVSYVSRILLSLDIITSPKEEIVSYRDDLAKDAFINVSKKMTKAIDIIKHYEEHLEF